MTRTRAASSVCSVTAWSSRLSKLTAVAWSWSDPQQQAFEAAVLHTLARPHPDLGPLHTPDVPLGLTAASPGVESFVL